jgi:hypothetical protein
VCIISTQLASGSSEEEESVRFIDDDSSEASSKDKTDHAVTKTTPLPKPTFLDLRTGNYDCQ